MRKSRWKIVFVSFSTALALVLLVAAVLGQEKSTKEPYPQLAVLSEVLSRVQTDYVEDPNFTKVTAGALHGLLESLDPYSSYLTAAEYKAYQSKHETEASLGIVISKRVGFIAIISLLPAGPASEAGLIAGDIIDSIDGQSTREMSLAEVNFKLQGAPGSSVKLSIIRERASDPKEFELKRAHVAMPDVVSRMMASGVGYLKVLAFPKGETQKIAASIQELRKNGAKKIILDLRDNAFGDIDEGVSTANLFIEKGLIGYVKGQQYPRKDFLSDSSKAISSKEPLIVLVNTSSGGAAEIVASAVLDTHRGDVVGERTYGIGSIQKVIPLDDGTALILSVAKYFTPAGKEIQDGGVTPNYPVAEDRDIAPLSEEEEPDNFEQPQKPKTTEDAPLKRALELLSSKDSQSKGA